jgi:hypothetical protein
MHSVARQILSFQQGVRNGNIPLYTSFIPLTLGLDIFIWAYLLFSDMVRHITVQLHLLKRGRGEGSSLYDDREA